MHTVGCSAKSANTHKSVPKRAPVNWILCSRQMGKKLVNQTSVVSVSCTVHTDNNGKVQNITCYDKVHCVDGLGRNRRVDLGFCTKFEQSLHHRLGGSFWDKHGTWHNRPKGKRGRLPMLHKWPLSPICSHGTTRLWRSERQVWKPQHNRAHCAGTFRWVQPG